MQRVTTDGESAIAPEVAELINKQDHTPVQSRERGAVRAGGEEDADPAPIILCHQHLERFTNPLFVCLDSN